MATPVTRAVVPAELQGLRPAGAYTFDELYRLAQVCHASGLFEDVSDASQAMIKIIKGQELGLPPTTAMTGFDLIRKRLFIKPWIIAAKINSCGYGSYQVMEQTPERCTILFRRKYAVQGWMSCEPVIYTWTEAKAQGLVERSPHWKASPAHMLYQRCMGRGGLMYFPELLAGLETPPDDTPLTDEHHQHNIVALFGDGTGAEATLPPRRERHAEVSRTSPPSEEATQEPHKEPARSRRTAPHAAPIIDAEPEATPIPAWREALQRQALELREFADGEHAPDLHEALVQLTDQALRLIEDPDATAEQGAQCREAMRRLADDVARQLGLPL